MPVAGVRLQQGFLQAAAGFGVLGLGFRVFGVQGLGFRVFGV